MRQKTLGVLVLFAVLFFSACGENPVIDLSNSTRKNTEETANSSNQEEGAAVINGNAAPASAQEPRQETQGMEPFDRDVFDTHRAAWEAEHPQDYYFYQLHIHSQIPLYPISASITVIDDIPYNPVAESEVELPDKNEWGPLLCNTVSELYKKIDTLWTEQRYRGALFLIKYEEQYHYPTDIQIKNLDTSGYDYLIVVEVWDNTNNIWAFPRPLEPEEIHKEPFDADVFKTQRVAWEAEHPSTYDFYQEHNGPPGMYLSGYTNVVNDIPYMPLAPGKNDLDPWLRCSTISDLYEKIDVLWTEQCNSNTSGLLLIEYDGQRHYPKHIQIRNINGSGYNYTVRIGIMYEEDMTEVHW